MDSEAPEFRVTPFKPRSTVRMEDPIIVRLRKGRTDYAPEESEEDQRTSSVVAKALKLEPQSSTSDNGFSITRQECAKPSRIGSIFRSILESIRDYPRRDIRRHFISTGR
ncbi:hypothetical protein KM043_006139 [Ampulex compressa]|nr:hypothetical protein KM043_006139 [Ampulex compressa]